MSEDNKGKADLDESGIWANVDSESGKAQAGEADFGGDSVHEDDERRPDDVIETTAKPVKTKSKAVYVIGLVGVLVVGFAGYIGYSLYTKLFAPDQGAEMAAASGAIMIDPASAFPGAPGGSSNAPSTVPMSSDPVPAVDATPSPEATSVAPPEAPVSADAPATGLAPVAVSAAAVAVAAAIQPPAPPPSCPQVVAPTCPVIQHEKAAVPQKAAARRVAKAPPQARSGTRTAQTKASPSASATPVAETGLGRLTGFRVLAIEPKVGDHQQAWLRGADGRMHIVREGESFMGSRVVSVSFAEGAVKTTAGEIRK